MEVCYLRYLATEELGSSRKRSFLLGLDSIESELSQNSFSGSYEVAVDSIAFAVTFGFRSGEPHDLYVALEFDTL